MFCSYKVGDLPIGRPAVCEFLLGELQERLSHETASDVVDGCGELGVAHFLLDRLEGFLCRGGVGDICGYAEGLAAGGFDLGDDFLAGGCGAGEQDDGVGLAELESYGPA